MKYRILVEKRPFLKERYIPQYCSFLWFWLNILDDRDFINSHFNIGYNFHTNTSHVYSIEDAENVISQYKKFEIEKKNRYTNVIVIDDKEITI